MSRFAWTGCLVAAILTARQIAAETPVYSVRSFGAVGSTKANDVLARAPYPPSPVIAGVFLDWSTHRRLALGSDNWQLTWADDDHQYGAWGDGGGFTGGNNDGRVGLGYGRIEGGWSDYKGFDAWGGKNAENPSQFTGKSWGTICIDGVLYSWIIPDEPDTGGPRDHYRYIQLAKSTDHAAHWTTRTGSLRAATLTSGSPA